MITIYKIKGSNMLFSPLESILETRGISSEDINWYMNPTPFEYSSHLLGNIDKGMHLFLSHIEKDNHIHVQIDKDFDGVTSSSILLNYTKRVFPNANITWTNHGEEKKHGIDIDLVPSTTNLLIVPDASSNEYETHKTLHDKGIDILLLDHHEAPKYSEHAVVINNQLDDYPNTQLSGAAIVYKFIQHIDKYLGINEAENFKDLVAFGLIGDGMRQNNKETFWLIKNGLENIKNEMLIELIKENVDKGVELTPTVVAFKINPKINSLLRVGNSETLDELVMAFLEHQEITYNSRLRREDKSETWARRMTRICNNHYSKQRKIRDIILEEVEFKIERDKLYNFHFIIVEVEGEFVMNMSGYVSMSVVNKYRKPCLILRKNKEGKLMGSMRGYDPLMKDTKDFLNSLNLFEIAEGHQSAAGLVIDKENAYVLNEKINEKLEHVELDDMYYVDFEMESKAMTETFIEDMEKYTSLWGQGIESPLYVIKNVKVDASDINLIGKAQNVLKFNKGLIEYVQFTADPKLVELKNSGKTAVMNVIGKTSINSWLGRKTSQVVVEAVDIKEIKDKPVGITFEF